ncbi:MAG: hypothetical protein WCE68_14690 [Anaerolineales bacterium]
MQTIGILAAMPQERDALLHLVKPRQRLALGPFRCQHFRLSDRDCWLVTSGMGPERAARAAHALLEAAHPQVLVSFGIAGAVNADLEIGDVLACRVTGRFDQGRLSPLQPLSHLSEAAWNAAAQALQPHSAHLLPGTAVSTSGSLVIPPATDPLENPVLEMETARIARVAVENGLPLLSLRSISDGPRAPIPFNLEAMMDDEYNLRIGKIIIVLLSHPSLLSRLLRMGRNTDIAAHNAAIALVAALSQPGEITAKNIP